MQKKLVHNSFLTPISSTSHPSHSSPHPTPLIAPPIQPLPPKSPHSWFSQSKHSGDPFWFKQENVSVLLIYFDFLISSIYISMWFKISISSQVAAEWQANNKDKDYPAIHHKLLRTIHIPENISKEGYKYHIQCLMSSELEFLAFPVLYPSHKSQQKKWKSGGHLANIQITSGENLAKHMVDIQQTSSGHPADIWQRTSSRNPTDICCDLGLWYGNRIMGLGMHWIPALLTLSRRMFYESEA